MAPSNVLQPLQEAQNTSEMPKHEAFNHEYVLADLAQTPTEQQHNLVYDNDEEEPKIDARTWMACAAMLLLNLVLTFALQGPPVVLSIIAEDLHGTQERAWVLNAYILTQAVLAPIVSSASDKFQVRKPVIIVCCIISLIGAAIAPGSTNIYRLIVAQALIGVGANGYPLAYSIPSEILPRKWRPMIQGIINIAAALGAIAAPLTIGALTRWDSHKGWRHFYWIQVGLWGATALGIAFGYRPSKRHSRYDHLSLWQKISHLDLPGTGLLTSGLSLFLAGLSLGANPYTWTSARVLSTLCVGIVLLVAFGLYEWKGTKTGILHHELFRGDQGRTFTLCIGLIAIEGIMFFSYVLFNPLMSSILFTQDTFRLAVRSLPFFIAMTLTTALWGYWSSRFRTIRNPLFAGYFLVMGFTVAFATIKPGQGLNQLVFSAGLGAAFGSPLILLISATQLAVPYSGIATATAIITSVRAIASGVATAIYLAVFNARITSNLPSYIAKAATEAGLPDSSIPAFIGALTSNNITSLESVTGATPHIIAEGVSALGFAYADSIRIVYIIAAPFGLLACAMVYFLPDMKKTMNYHVDAPIKELHAKHHRSEG